MRDGICREAGLMNDWTKSPPKLAWTMKGAGQGMSSVSIAGGRIYTLGKRAGEKDPKQGTCLICADAATQKILWTLLTCEGGDEPNSSPTVDGGRVYVLDRKSNLVCADAVSGAELWRRNLEKDFGGKMESGWGWSESPTVDGGKVIITPGAGDALLVALDAKTGKSLWKTASGDLGKNGNDGASYSSVVVSKAAGRKQYVQLTGRAVVGVDAENGKLLWHYGEVNNGTANIPTPLVWGDFVFASTGYGAGAALLKISKSGSGLKADEVYRLDSRVFQNHHGGMVYKDGFIYAGTGHNNGFPICLEAETGKVRWGGDRHPEGRESAALLVTGDRLIFRYQNGIMAMLDASPDAKKERGSFKLDHIEGSSWPHPVISDGKLYVRDQDVVMCYDMKP